MRKNNRYHCCHFLLQGIFATQGSNPSLLHCRQTLYGLSHQGNFLTDTTEIQKIIREYNKQLFVNKLEDLEEVDKLLESYNPPRLNHEERKSE